MFNLRQNTRNVTRFNELDEAVVIDVETTGPDPENDRIVCVALIYSAFEDLRESQENFCGDSMDTIVNPQCEIPQQASRIHGINNKDVVDKGSFADVAEDLRYFIGDLPVVGHNVSFHKSFLNSEFKRAGVETLAHNRSYCTKRRYQKFNGGHREGSNLHDVVRVMGWQNARGNRQKALEDATETLLVASMFYMMDNRIKIPGGKPIPPYKKRILTRFKKSGHQKRQPKISLEIIGATALIIGLLIWWLQ